MSLRTPSTLPHIAPMAWAVWQHCHLHMSKTEFQMDSGRAVVLQCWGLPLHTVSYGWRPQILWGNQEGIMLGLWAEGRLPMDLGKFLCLPILYPGTMYRLCTSDLASVHISPCNPALIHISYLWRSQAQLIPNILGISNLFIYSAYKKPKLDGEPEVNIKLTNRVTPKM